MKKRYSQEQREEIVNKYKNRTDKKSMFAKAEGISEGTLNKWIEEVEKEEEPKFIKVRMPEIGSTKSNIIIRFEGFEIIVDENSSEELLSLALRGVKRIC